MIKHIIIKYTLFNQNLYSKTEQNVFGIIKIEAFVSAIYGHVRNI
jgi:hypothetical protein